MKQVPEEGCQQQKMAAGKWGLPNQQHNNIMCCTCFKDKAVLDIGHQEQETSPVARQHSSNHHSCQSRVEKGRSSRNIGLKCFKSTCVPQPTCSTGACCSLQGMQVCVNSHTIAEVATASHTPHLTPSRSVRPRPLSPPSPGSWRVTHAQGESPAEPRCNSAPPLPPPRV